jgi:hypothetical protein
VRCRRARLARSVAPAPAKVFANSKLTADASDAEIDPGQPIFQPVSRFVLEMQSGKKGLIVNSRHLCANPSRASARLSAQNGRRHDSNPQVRAAGCAKRRGAKRR